MTEAALLDLGRSRTRLTRQSSRASHAPFTSAAAIVAYAGAAPLLVAALFLVVDRDAYGHAATRFLVVYGAALLIFFAGVRWGVAVMKPEGPSLSALAGAVAPFAAAMPLALPGPIDVKLAAIMLFMAILLVDDLKTTHRGSGAPAWYLAVRVPLTVLIEVSFLVALAARIGA